MEEFVAKDPGAIEERNVDGWTPIMTVSALHQTRATGTHTFTWHWQHARHTCTRTHTTCTHTSATCMHTRTRTCTHTCIHTRASLTHHSRTTPARLVSVLLLLLLLLLLH